MACSRFEYVKQHEFDHPVPMNSWFILRIDGRSYGIFADKHNFEKPNDSRACSLMVDSAQEVMRQFNDIILAYGQSDEFSFLFQRSTNLWNRRHNKILTNIVSLFTSTFVFKWSTYFDMNLTYPPSFDGRIVCYPTDQNIIDYFSWRQADCHINNLYNTCFWCLVNNGTTKLEAHKFLSGTNSSEKNELLFSSYNINYNSLPQLYRKGTIIIRQDPNRKSKNSTKPNTDNNNNLNKMVLNTINIKREENQTHSRQKENSYLLTVPIKGFLFFNEDLISKKFWLEHFVGFISPENK